MKTYRLLNEKGESYESSMPGALGGHRKGKIYGRLDCPNALRWIANGHYMQSRVFFRDEATARAAGYRPCGICMKAAYCTWKGGA